MDNQQQEIIQSTQVQPTLKNAPHIPNPLKAKGITFENDFGKKPLMLAHLTKDQGIIVVLSAAAAFIGGATPAGVPLFALIVAAAINDIKYAGSKNASDKKVNDEPTPPRIEQETIDVPVKVVSEERINSSPGADEEQSESQRAFQPTVDSHIDRSATGTVTLTVTQPPNVNELRQLPIRERAIAILTHLSKDGFDLEKAIADQITCICGNQRGGKGTLMAILAILARAIDPTTKVHYFTAGDDIYPFKCDRLVCRLSYPGVDGDKADLMVAQALYQYLKEMDKLTQGACKDIILVIDEAVALSDYLDPEQKQWMIRFLLTRANKKGAMIFIVLHGKSLTSWVGTGNTSGFSQTFKNGATFIGCEATSIKINPLRSMSVAKGRYFLADPDDFSKSIEGGELGVVPEWLKRQINPATVQPDPARTLLEFFPELRSDPQAIKAPIDKPSCSSDYQAPTDKQAWDRWILESTQEQINELIEQRRSKPSIASDNSESLETIDQQIDFAVDAIAEYLREKELGSDTARNIYNGKNRLKKVAKTMNDFKDLLEVASELGKIYYFSDGTSTRVSLIN